MDMWQDLLLTTVIYPEMSFVLIEYRLFRRKKAATPWTSSYLVRSKLLDRQCDVFSNKKVAFQCK